MDKENYAVKKSAVDPASEHFKRDAARMKKGVESKQELKKYVTELGADEYNSHSKREFEHISKQERQTGIENYYKINRQSFKATGDSQKDQQVAKNRIASYMAHSALGLYQPGKMVRLSDLNIDPAVIYDKGVMKAHIFLNAGTITGKNIAADVNEGITKKYQSSPTQPFAHGHHRANSQWQKSGMTR